jgi:hypothetical protein
MIPSNTWPHTHRDLIQHYYAQYDESIASAEFQPLVFPWAGLGAVVVIIYLLIPHQKRPWLEKARYAVFAFNVAHVVYSIRNVRAKNMASSLGLGLILAWSVIWTLAILVCHDPQTDFQRIERTEGLFGRGGAKDEAERNGGTEKTADGIKRSIETLQTDNANSSVTTTEHLGPSKRHGEFAWQPYPLTPFVERVDWVLDVFGNFRGAGWNWRTIATPPPPKEIEEQLYRNSTNPPQHTFRQHPSQPAVYSTRRTLLIENLKSLIAGYIVLDLLKTIVVHDPYFWGFVDGKPGPYLPSLITDNPILLHMCRLIVSQFAIKYALQTIFSLAPLIFSGVLGPSLIGARAEPWIYPETWGSYTQVLDGGLGGWWSAWWHQTFRFAFEAPSRKIIKNMGMNHKAPGAKFLQLVVAFGLSGLLHACGSHTSHGSTQPILGPLRFFLLQAFALFGEAIITSAIHKTGLQNHMPRWVKRTFTFFYVHLWFYHTAGLLCADFARGGVWLFEPIPISLFRGMGLGTQGDGWWCWGDTGLRWHTGDRWWMSGIAV